MAGGGGCVRRGRRAAGVRDNHRVWGSLSEAARVGGARGRLGSGALGVAGGGDVRRRGLAEDGRSSEEVEYG